MGKNRTLHRYSRIYRYARSKRAARRRAIRRQIWLCVAILCSAFLIAAGARWLPQAAEDGSGTSGGEGQPSGTGEELAEENPDIRVLLMTDGYQKETHARAVLSSESGLVVNWGDREEEVEEKLTVEPEDDRFKEGVIRVRARDGKVKVETLHRGYGMPSYAGIIELRVAGEGLVLINELPLETYLEGVVPSEMPASYEPEALKAQAVCARSFACRQMESFGYPEYKAHVNDSTDYQVYGNSKPAESAGEAVRATAGEAVRYQGKVVTTYYYSTSCGRTTNVEAWGTKPGKANAYLQSVEVKGKTGDYEKELPWYRWEARIPKETLSRLIRKNTRKDIGMVEEVKVTKRGPGDVALAIRVTGREGTVTVKTENKIRRALGGEGYEIQKQDGTTASSSRLLPSAFFTVKKEKDCFVIRGGGYGHGIGMSQNGANEMAKQGMDYREILTLFYQGVTIE